jgi:Na+-transporting NADH:ubiquinone oxidoreductase subunit A
MVHIKIKKGLDIPIEGGPQENRAEELPAPPQISLNLDPFEDVKFHLIAKVGDMVKIGEPVAEDKECKGRMFVSPAHGVINEIRRGHKRRIIDVVIDVKGEEYLENPAVDPNSASREEITQALKQGGAFAHIRQRPFGILADPAKKPRSIFVKAIESAPFVPAAEKQVEGREADFQAGLTALSKLSGGPVHLVFKKGTQCRAFLEAKGVEKHTAEGPHPVANPSLHIQEIDPIGSYEDVVWTLNAHDVVGLGHLLRTGKYFINRVIAIAGPGVIPDKIGYFHARAGYPITHLIAGRINKGFCRFVSGDPLNGKKVEAADFLGFNDYVFTVIPEKVKRTFLHFFRLGTKQYTFSKAYMTGHLKNREYPFTTSLHGEHRAFIDGSLYDKVMPLNISTILLVKAIMAEDFDLAEQLGILDVDGEDFALPTFVCPSKIEMVDIVKQGLKRYSDEIQGK